MVYKYLLGICDINEITLYGFIIEKKKQTDI